MLHEFVYWLSSLFWLAATLVIAAGIWRALRRIVSSRFRDAQEARSEVAQSIVSALGLTTAIALLATTELRGWRAIGMFAAIAGLRMFTKAAAKYNL